MTIHTLMIDVDGVLVRGDGGHWSDALERDMGIAREALNQAFFIPHWRDVVTGRADLVERLEEALDRIAPGVTPGELIAYWFDRDSAIDRPLLEEIDQYRDRGLQVLLATNQEHLRADHLLNALGLAGHVDGMVYSAALGCRKPEPEFFEGAALRAGSSPREILLVDDTPENVDGAILAGWRAALWKGGSSLRAIVERASA